MEYKIAEIGDQILGRIGYILIWKNLSAMDIILQDEIEFDKDEFEPYGRKLDL